MADAILLFTLWAGREGSGSAYQERVGGMGIHIDIFIEYWMLGSAELEAVCLR